MTTPNTEKKRKPVTAKVLGLPDGIFSHHMYPCIHCMKEINLDTHEIDYVGTNTRLIKCK